VEVTGGQAELVLARVELPGATRMERFVAYGRNPHSDTPARVASWPAGPDWPPPDQPAAGGGQDNNADGQKVGPSLSGQEGAQHGAKGLGVVQDAVVLALKRDVPPAGDGLGHGASAGADPLR